VIVFSFILLIATVVLSLGSLRTARGDALGLPVVAIGGFVFLYIVQPLRVIQMGAMDTFLTDWQVCKAVAIPALMLGGFVWGWLRTPSTSVRGQPASWNPAELWHFGLGTALVGFCLYAVFIARSGGVLAAFSQQHGHAMAFEQNTAYLYDGPWWILSGVAMMMCAASRFSVYGWRRGAPSVFVSAVLAHALLTGSRGPLFSAVAVFCVGTAIRRRKILSVSQAFAILSLVGTGVLLVVGYRAVLHLGPQDSERPSLSAALGATVDVSEADMSNRIVAQEFILHAAVLDTVDNTHKLDLGLSWAYFIAINPVPKLLWAEKHYPASPGITQADIFDVTGLRFAVGSAPGIVADLYRQFWLGAVLFMYIFGRLSRRLFVCAWSVESPLANCSYVMLYALSLNVFAQGFSAIFVPFLFSLAPVVAFTILSGWRRRPGVLSIEGSHRLSGAVS
jgi:hypothetical protein